MTTKFKNFTIINTNLIIDESYKKCLEFSISNDFIKLLSAEARRLWLHYIFENILDIFRQSYNKNFIFYITQTDKEESWIYEKIIKLLTKFKFIILVSNTVQYDIFINMLNNNDSPEFDEISNGYFDYTNSLLKLNQYLKQGSFIKLVKKCKGLEMLKLIIPQTK